MQLAGPVLLVQSIHVPAGATLGIWPIRASCTCLRIWGATPFGVSVAATSNVRSTRVFSSAVRFVRFISATVFSNIGASSASDCAGQRVGQREQPLGERDDLRLLHHERHPLAPRRVFERDAPGIADEAVGILQQRVDVSDRGKARLPGRQPLAHDRFGRAALDERRRVLERRGRDRLGTRTRLHAGDVHRRRPHAGVAILG